jgi:two-component system, NtrC family, sensor histidine kinase HydH
MWKKRAYFTVAGPTVLVSVLLLALCTATAVFLYRQQTGPAEDLEDAYDSRKVALELESTIRTLIPLLRQGGARVAEHDETLTHLTEKAHELANTEREVELVQELEDCLERMHANWPRGEPTPPEPAVAGAVRALEDARKIAAELRRFNTQEIERSRASLRTNIKRLAWGLLAFGVIASIAGVVLGYMVARALRRSIHQLSVRIRDAADKLRQELPTVTLTSGRDVDHLHEQIQGLVPQIEQVVDRLQQREREVRRAEQLAAVGQLAAGVAHELRNPLTAIKMLVQTSREDLEKRGLPPEDLQTIETEIRRLEKSLQSFLDFARPPKADFRPLDLSEVVEEAFGLVRPRARRQGVELQFAPPEPPVEMHADAEQLRQVLLNLCLNALDAMPHGGTLTVDIQARHKNHVEIRVRDTGPGIAAHIAPRLFEPFVSGKDTGLGLGLVVSRRIAEAHGGSLWGVNQPQGGACFVLRLPLTTRVPVAV